MISRFDVLRGLPANMVHIYVLKCQEGKYYVGKTNQTFKRFSAHSSGRGAKWTQKYKPIDLAHWYPDRKDSDETKITIQMMRKYGVNNVRGGPYTQVQMTKRQANNLENKIKSKSINKSVSKKKTLCKRCGRDTHTISKCYARRHTNGKPLIQKNNVNQKDFDDFLSVYAENRRLKAENKAVKLESDKAQKIIEKSEREIKEIESVKENNPDLMLYLLETFSEEENIDNLVKTVKNTSKLFKKSSKKIMKSVIPIKKKVKKTGKSVKKIGKENVKKGKKILR